MISHEVRFAGALCGLAAFTTVLAAQEPVRRDTTPPPGTDRATARAMHFVALDEFLGADVKMRANAEERREAREEGEKADRPEGEIDDLVIGPDGKIRWAVVDVGGFLGIGEKSVAVPISALDCQPKDQDEALVTVSATEKQLKALPEFDLDDAEKSGLRSVLQAAEASWSARGLPADADMKRDQAERTGGESTGGNTRREGREGVVEGERQDEKLTRRPETGAAPATSHATGDFVRASKIDDWKVRASDGELGSISKVFVSVDRQPTIGYVVVAVDTPGLGSTDYLMPYGALTRAKHDDDWVWTVAKSKADIQSGVKYEKPAQGVLNVETGRQADEFFGVKHDRTMRDHDGREPAVRRNEGGATKRGDGGR